MAGRIPRFIEPLIRQLRRSFLLWTDFWFAPHDPLPLCLMRWLVGGMLFYTHLVWGLRLEEFFGAENSWQAQEFVKAIQKDEYAFSFWWSIPQPWMWTTHVASLVVLGLFWIGAATRVTGWLAFLITVSYAQRVPLATFGLDQINGMSIMYLALAPCGARLSVDAWLYRLYAKRNSSSGQSIIDLLCAPCKSSSARMATRLLQVHLCVIYLWAGLGKLKGETWWNGEALWLSASNLEYQSNDLTWIIHFPWFYQIVTIVTWAWEISFPFLIWSPGLRPIMLLVGIGLHLGIGMYMGMWTFGLSMIFVYMAFVSSATIGRISEAFHRVLARRTFSRAARCE